MSDIVSSSGESERRTASLNHACGQIIVEELVRCGVGAFCISPGSRSTPLALAVAENHRSQSIVHFDERGTAYFALGCAKAAGRPSVLICTSGTAVANYFPAIIEASQSGVPLIVLTADRPPELLDAGANQAIDQTKIFGDYVRWQFALPCPDENVSPNFVLTTVDQAFHRATCTPAGPVHLNCMFREPFVHKEGDCDLTRYLRPLHRWKKLGGRHTRYAEPEQRSGVKMQAGIVEMIRAARRGLFVIGELRTAEERKAAKSLANALKWPVFADVASGLRLGNSRSPFVGYHDLILPVIEERPDTVIQIGAPFTSKRLLQYLSEAQPERYIYVDNKPARRDPIHAVTLRVQADIEPFCEGITARLTPSRKSDWLERLQKCGELVDKAIDAGLSQNSMLSEPYVARHVSLNAPEGGVLFLGNSMPIRDMDTFGSSRGASVQVAVNRGASGIDGNIATAIGHAAALQVPVTAILGDLAVLHDINSLAILSKEPLPLVLIVINNDGGGIFSFLPIAEHEEHFEYFFATPHGMTFEHAAAQFGIDYANPVSREEFAANYRNAITEQKPFLIEVRTDRDENVRVHRALREEIERCLAGGSTT